MPTPKKPTISDLINLIEEQKKSAEATTQAMIKLDARNNYTTQRVESLLRAILNVETLPDLSGGPEKKKNKKQLEFEVSASDLFDDGPLIPPTGT